MLKPDDNFEHIKVRKFILKKIRKTGQKFRKYCFKTWQNFKYKLEQNLKNLISFKKY